MKCIDNSTMQRISIPQVKPKIKTSTVIGLSPQNKSKANGAETNRA